jgi:hypothetical protein
MTVRVAGEAWTTSSPLRPGLGFRYTQGSLAQAISSFAIAPPGNTNQIPVRDSGFRRTPVVPENLIRADSRHEAESAHHST